MRYLKRFESVKSDIDYHMQVVRDVFQDIIDDYNIEEFITPADDDAYDIAGFYYHMSPYPEYNTNSTLDLKIVKSIRLAFFNQVINVSDIKNDVDRIDFTPPIKRLESMGYHVTMYMRSSDNGFTDNWAEIIINFPDIN